MHIWESFIMLFSIASLLLSYALFDVTYTKSTTRCHKERQQFIQARVLSHISFTSQVLSAKQNVNRDQVDTLEKLEEA